MSAAANLVFFDGASTPVSHTLVPVSIQRIGNKQRCLWREKLASVPDEAQVYAEETLEYTKAGTAIAEFKIVFPVMEAISGQNAAGYTAAPKVAYEDTYLITGMFSKRSTLTGRRTARQAAVNAFWSRTDSNAAATTGPSPELFDQLVMAT